MIALFLTSSSLEFIAQLISALIQSWSSSILILAQGHIVTIIFYYYVPDQGAANILQNF